MTTTPKTTTLLLAVLLVTTACSSPPLPPTATSTFQPTSIPGPTVITDDSHPIPPPTISSDGSLLHQDLPPDTSPTVEHPTLHLVITVTDRETDQPIAADVTVDNVTAHAVTTLQVYLDANQPHTIVATAPGYERWSHTIRTHLHHHKRMGFTIPLSRMEDGGDAHDTRKESC